ncbi:nagb/rpia/CoA transferase-like protein [Tilletiopsis washingtonensis]|uniref:5-formyltetrahydrofolate cyclo-ligase n=1 Tax=Tilletiopsis washingtonensis TaxID=58919 RepID=A0A316Z8Z3_9BASI|nr:nagb/rpia/CoA transferase-like protein [Tilletiopsis washingtonensis]PWN98051.1 nagb/rpia/CoA transferase-like protein [Tilletiopsis washingtonensis]
MSTLRLQKRALRRTLLATLGALAPAALAEQSGAVAAHLFATAAWTRARAVGVFVGAAGEVATDAVVRRGLAEGKHIYIPHFTLAPADAAAPAQKSFAPDMRMLRLHDVAAFEALKENAFGIREFAAAGAEMLEARDADPPMDLVLVPGVAFDHACCRLGHGKGYYDRYLSSLAAHHASRSMPAPLLVGLALAPQLLRPGEAVPTDAHDLPLDAVVHPAGVVPRADGRAV